MDLTTQIYPASSQPRNIERAGEPTRRQSEDVEPSGVSFPTILQETRQPVQTGNTREQVQGNQNTVSGKELQNGSENAETPSAKVITGQTAGAVVGLKGLAAMLSANAQTEETAKGLTAEVSAKETLLKTTTPNITQPENSTHQKPTDTLAKAAVISDSVNASGGKTPTLKTISGEPAAITVEGEKPTTNQTDATVGSTKSPVINDSNISQVASDGAVTGKIQNPTPTAPSTSDDISSTMKETANAAPKAEAMTQPTAKISLEGMENVKALEATPTAAKEQAPALKQNIEQTGSLKLDEKIEVVIEPKVATESKEVTEEVTTKVTAKVTAEIAPLVSPGSESIEQLSAQSQANKVYHQPTVSADNGATAKTTLADLDLDSGSTSSQESKQESISRLLSSTSNPTAAKTSIKGQVLSQVVKHLQEEMGREKLTIRLNPEKLGLVEIQFQTKGDNLNIVMSASNQEAEGIIKEGARELAENIADKSMRWNLVDVRVDNRGQDQPKQESRQNERREKQDEETKQQHQGRQNKQEQQNNAGAGEWAAFHLGG